ncbi:hypothetical protein PF008_g22496 [Phytophthora fragariae]|uniref:Uncharacterized protein n=1 Tax=Phytophthora fragariae TaxID=53985 RepID=A0A6G0QUH8_9STRA|nr:hypothetical protein PF008_g22496 [Phytophthora fragariae]
MRAPGSRWESGVPPTASSTTASVAFVAAQPHSTLASRQPTCTQVITAPQCKQHQVSG